MANYSAIKAAVNAYIKANGRKEITGSILNAVLNATIDSLGRYFQFAGGAMPTDDPGTPDQNVCYLATEPGLYIHFGNIRINNEEVALLFWNGEWVKQTIAIGIQEVNASVDNQVGTPYVDVSYSGGRLILTFHNLKGRQGNPGDPGVAAGFGTIGADITGGVGTPGVSVETSGDNTAKNLMFHFTNLKGETGVTSVVATIDNTSGTPSCRVSLANGVLTLAFSGLKGLQGDTGSSVDYPFTIANNLITDDPTQALSAAMGVQLESEIGQLENQVDDVIVVGSSVISPNVFDKSAVTEDYAVRKDYGTLLSTSDWVASDYIPIPEGETTLCYGPMQGFSGVIGWACYDSGKVFTHGGGTYPTFEVGDAYFRISIRKTLLDSSMVVFGTEDDYPSEYVPYGAIVSYKLKDDSVRSETISDAAVTKEKLAFLVEMPGKNLADVSQLAAGKFWNASGELGIGLDYSASPLIEVTPGEPYHLSLDNDEPVVYGTGSVYICFFHDGVFVSNLPSNTKQFTIPSGANQVGFSVSNTRLEDYGNLQLEAGTERTSYEPYDVRDVIDPDLLPDQTIADGSVETEMIADGAVTSEKLSPNISIPSSPAKFSGWEVTGNGIAPGASLELNKYFRCRKGFQTSAVIVGSIGLIQYNIGSLYFLVSANNLTIGGNDYPHGLTLGDITTIIVNMGDDRNITENTKIRIIDDSGHTFEKDGLDMRLFAGKVSIQNANASGNLDIRISAFNKDLCKRIWMFGDSYFSYIDPARWTYHVMSWGYDNYLLCAEGGKTASDLYNDLVMLLESGARPGYIVWCLGMNGGTDENGSVNSAWLAVANNVISLCSQIGATLVFGTIPSIPSASHVAMNEWIRASGFRYIDFAAAVEDPNQGGANYWRLWGDNPSVPEAGSLLSNDKVHPTQFGAVELASRVLVDFQEMSVLE